MYSERFQNTLFDSAKIVELDLKKQQIGQNLTQIY